MFKRTRRVPRIWGHPQCVFLAIDEPWRRQSLERLHEGEPLSTACGGNFERGKVNQSKRAAQWAVAPTEVAGVCMSAYEITMIIIASMTLLLKLIEVIKDLIQK